MHATYTAAEARLWAAQKSRTLNAFSATTLLADLFTPRDLLIIQNAYTYLYWPGTCNTDAVYSTLATVKSITQELELVA